MLTGQKKKFADALKKGMTQREAAVEAGYSEKTAKVKGSQLARDPDVTAYLERSTEISQGINPEVNPPLSDRKQLSQAMDYPDPLAVMAAIMVRNQNTDEKLALEAAAKLASYVCSKNGSGGKKEEKAKAAKKAENRFPSLAPPKLVVNNSRGQ
ncbi:terminase small subunit [Morganella morganii]|uniref:terminase small subunit n=1 Tax=Morganella morganii TaxID=582 RepID=UPI003866DA14